MSSPAFPRLLYVGDVPVEATVAGSALLYRLLQKYPPPRLQIVEGNTATSKPEKRLPGVDYGVLQVGHRRLLHTRLASCYAGFLCLTAARRAQQLHARLADFKPEGILTVAHGYSWISAAQLAKQQQLPLHLVVHDDWPTNIYLPRGLKKWGGRAFGRIYRQAALRYCVSPQMEETYRRRYGVAGTVLFPSRAVDCPEYDQPPERLLEKRGGLTVVFAGTINTPGYGAALVALAEALRAVNGRLLLFSPLSPEGRDKLGLNLDHVEVRPTVPARELIATLRAEADVVYAPMTFEPEYEINMQLSFPSKLTDYTATGLPVLIFGPPYCSAVQWARENPGVAEVVDRADPQALGAAVKKLSADPACRYQLGAGALKLGRHFFSHAAVTETFYRGLLPAA